MTRARCSAIAVAVTCAATVGMAQERSQPTDAARVQALRARGLALGYNLDHDAALATFREALAIDPHDAGSHRLVAATLWIKTLIAQGAVTAEDFLGQAGTSLRKPARAEELEAAIGRADNGRADARARFAPHTDRRGVGALRDRRRLQSARVVHRHGGRRRPEEPCRRAQRLSRSPAGVDARPAPLRRRARRRHVSLRGVGAAALVAARRADRRVRRRARAGAGARGAGRPASRRRADQRPLRA